MVYLQRWHGWCHMKLLPSRRIQCTPRNHTPCHFMQYHIRRVHAYLAVTCHLHFWQNGRGLLRATAVKRGWNGYRNKNQHRKQTPSTGLRHSSFKEGAGKRCWECAQKVDPGEENYAAAPARIRTRDLSITSPAL